MNNSQTSGKKLSKFPESTANKLTKNLSLVILCLILLLGLFFRVYQLRERMNFAQDGDLYSWIVKDIIVNHHLRLIGQQTTAEGIFIGAAYYYAIIPFFLLTKMDPFGAAIFTTIVGILSVLSYYIVFSKIFNKGMGLIASFLQAILIGPVYFDRRVVPSTPTNLWVVWYFYTVILLARGNYSALPLLALLIAAIWHIHIALIPALLAVPVAVLLSKRLPTLRQFTFFVLLSLVLNLPLFIFEARHHFIQTKSLITNFTVNHEGGTGLSKWNHVFQMVSGNAEVLFFYPQKVPYVSNRMFFIVLFLLPLLLLRKKIISLREFLPLYAWVAGVLLFFTISSSTISEYYFNSIEVVEILSMAGLGYLIYKGSRLGKLIVLFLACLVLVKNLNFFINEYIYHKGYVERKSAAEFVVNDAKKRGFPCVAVSYITSPGENVGFRYFFWLDHLHVNQPKDGGPVYSIVIPSELADGKGKIIFGHIGVIPPEQIPPKNQIVKSCSGSDDNLTDPVFGYTE